MSYYEIVFQIPKNVSVGQEITLKAVPRFRPTKRVGKDKRLAPMKNGEITAFRYGNPLMGWMKRSKISNVTIVSISKTQVVIRLRLKANLDQDWDFDMDEQFTLQVISPEDRKNERAAQN